MPGDRWRGARLLPLLVALTCVPAPAAALPLRVLARSRLELSAGGDTEQVVVRARLLDDLGLGLSERNVRLQCGERAVVRRSGADGGLPAWRLDKLDPGTHTVRAAFDGDGRGYQRSSAEREFEVRRPRPRLTLEMAARVRGERPLRVSVRATLRTKALSGLRVSLSLDEGRVVATRFTDGSGRAGFVVGAAQLGGPGQHAVVVRSEETSRLRAGYGSGQVLRELPTRLSARLELQEGLLVDRVVASGRLVAGGEAVARRRVQVRRQAGAWVSAGTDSEGRWALAWARDRLQPGLQTVHARFGGEPGLDPARAEAELVVPRLPPRSDLPQVIVALVTLLCVGGLVAVWAARGKWRPAGTPQPHDDPWRAPPPPVPVVPTWSQVRGEELVAEDDRPTDRVIGQLWDRLRGLPIAGGHLRLFAGAAEADATPAAETSSDRRGVFVLRPAGAGRYTLQAQAAGYVTEQRLLVVPSRLATGLRVGLMPVREMVRRTWVAAAERHLAEGTPVWGRRTPAEVLAECVASGEEPPGGRLEDLTTLSEGVIWGRGPFHERVFRSARRLVGGEGGEEGSHA